MDSTTENEEIPCCVSSPVLVVCRLEHLQGKVFDVGGASWLVVDRVVWTDLLLEAFEGIEEVEEKVSGIGVLGFEGYAKLRSIVGT